MIAAPKRCAYLSACAASVMLAAETDQGSDSFSDAILATWRSLKTAEGVDLQLAAVTCTQIWSLICSYTSTPIHAGQRLAFQLQNCRRQTVVVLCEPAYSIGDQQQ